MPKGDRRRARTARPHPTTPEAPVHDPLNRASNFAVVAIGASAGGLDATRKLLAALPADTGMAFVLVQHLEPTHESMMVDLLAGHTSLTVRQAADATLLEREHLYVIAPGTYLSIQTGALQVCEPPAKRGARLPFDFLLHSLAEECGTRAICVILSGTGADGSLGLKAVKEKCGLVVAQNPEEADYEGMPRSAIMTGSVDLVLPVGEIGQALIAYDRRMGRSRADAGSARRDAATDWLPKIVDLLRNTTSFDFTLYKPGTLERRIERRVALAPIESDSIDSYRELLERDAGERDLLAKDLLINVTRFFRDSKVFDVLTERIVADLVQSVSPGRTLRIWVAGCSTGEEAYSLAILFGEALAGANGNVKLQVFASDIDADAVALAREGLYPESIEADVTSDRLSRFFLKENDCYRVSPELRATVVFTVQDVLADPPFSRLDLVSCRNLLIYLTPEGQTRIFSLFHFALREGGVLMLGSAEATTAGDHRFEPISKADRLYRHIGQSRPGESGFLPVATNGARPALRSTPGLASPPGTSIADLCQRLVVDAYAPAAILISQKHEVLYSVGPTDRFLHVAQGRPSHDLFAMARQGVRTKLRSAILQASHEGMRVVVHGARLDEDASSPSFTIDVRPVTHDDLKLLLVAFIEEPAKEWPRGNAVAVQDPSYVLELQQALETTRAELQGAIRSLERSSDEQKATQEEALSISEEYQSTNEELLASKEEYQSLNEELTALNGQLQETLERQRSTSDDLTNVLYSTNVATIFLDSRLVIRFFTPAINSLFHVIPSDIGRPFADLRSLAADGDLQGDARMVLDGRAPTEREIEASGKLWCRRISPYRTRGDRVEGVVITFIDITERSQAAAALTTAKQQAELANVAKSRFLAAASHDLRQPLQTLTLLHGLLAKNVDGAKAQQLVARLGDTLGAMSGMLNTLLDINQIEAGVVRPETVRFPINDLLGRMRDEFIYHAQAQRLELRVTPSSLWVESDPRLLDQMVRNLLSNALKYTKQGKVLLGCRRRAGVLSIEVWDTGVGIPDDELQAIFDEYHQLDNPARERSRGLGLGLSIVKRLANLLGHPVRVQSRRGRGSVFAIEISQPSSEARAPSHHASSSEGADDEAPSLTGDILIIEDDLEVRETLELLLRGEGHQVYAAADGASALAQISRGLTVDLVLADYNLPGGLNGLQFTANLRESYGKVTPVIILTGDISTDTLRDIAAHDCVQLNKPVKVTTLLHLIQSLLAQAPPAATARRIARATSNAVQPIVFVVDDDGRVRDAIRSVLEEDGKTVEDYSDGGSFLAAYQPGHGACLLIDAYMPGMSGADVLERLQSGDGQLPTIMITGDSDVGMAVKAMKAGACDFIEKPFQNEELLASVNRAVEQSLDSAKLIAWRESARKLIKGLTRRERQVMDLVLAGDLTKNIAVDLGISTRTVENHRAAIMRKTDSKSLPALARLALAIER